MSSMPISAKIARRVSYVVSKRAHDLVMHQLLQQCQVANASLIQTWTTQSELEQLYRLAAACPPNSVALEIGSYLGASTCYIAAGLSANNGRLLCVDTWQNETMPEGERDTFAEFSQNVAGVKDRLTLIRKRSEQLTDADVKELLHLVFIDGDHSYESAKADFEKVTPWLSAEGVVAFHDSTTFQGVSRVIGEALTSREWAVAGQVESLLWIKRMVWER